jgi:ABC-type transporter Mla maintaining outer membrane lipid asymmetry ATPase subunit MlaF
MISFEDVWFSYGSRPVLQGASFSIATHERVAVLGGSGEGKTTILKLIMGLIRGESSSMERTSRKRAKGNSGR